MEIIVGENAGFCYGVKRAVLETSRILEGENEVFCLGELVHNKTVINKLKENGAIFIEDISNDVKNVVIRAHGISKDIYEYMEKNKITYFDYTCPNVLNIHKIAEEYAKKDYYIFLLGDPKHPENIGTISFCGKKSCVIESVDEVDNAIKKLEKEEKNNLLIIAQTTFSVNNFNNIIEKIKEKLDKNINLEIRNTICSATEIRQKETEELAKKVDYMIIIGGKNSSNTKKLYDIAKNNCKEAICVENKDELNIEVMKKFERIGIMAGASTPQESIDEVKEKLLLYK